MSAVDLLKKLAREFMALMSQVNERVKSLDEIGFPLEAEIRSSFAGANRLLEIVLKVPAFTTIERLKHGVSTMGQFLKVSAEFERRYLTALITSEAMRERIFTLHQNVLMENAEAVNDFFNGYDASRCNSGVSTVTLRLEYMGLRDALVSMELESERLKEIDREAAKERIRATMASAVVGTIKPARRNKTKARAKSATHRALVEAGNKIGKKQKSA